MLMNKVFSALGGVSVILLSGSYFVKDTPQDIMRLLGFILLFVSCIYKIMRSGKDSKKN